MGFAEYLSWAAEKDTCVAGQLSGPGVPRKGRSQLVQCGINVCELRKQKKANAKKTLGISPTPPSVKEASQPPGTELPLQSKARHLASTTNLIPGIQFFAGRAWRGIVAVSAVLSLITAVYTFLPSVSVSVPACSFADPYDCLTSIANMTQFTLSDVTVNSITNQIIFQNGQTVRILDPVVAPYFSVESLSPGEVTSTEQAKIVRLFLIPNGTRLLSAGAPGTEQAISVLYTAPCQARPALATEVATLVASNPPEIPAVSIDVTTTVGFFFVGFHHAKRSRALLERAANGIITTRSMGMREPLASQGGRELMTITKNGFSADNRVGPRKGIPAGCPN